MCFSCTQDNTDLANEDIQNLLRTGIQAAQSGNKMTARQLLQEVVERDPKNELAWMWMASVADTTPERRDCLKKVLAINPGNQRAREALNKLDESPAQDLLSSRGALGPDRPLRGDVLPREGLVRAPRRKRKRSPVYLFTVGFLAVSMIGLGLLLLWDYSQNDDNKTASNSTQAAVLPTSTRSPLVPTRTLRPTTLLPPATLPTTWTPSPTFTPSPTIEATATPSLANDTLLVSGQRSGQYDFALYSLVADGSQEAPIQMRLAASVGSGISLVEAFDASYSPDGQRIAFTAQLRSTQSGEFEEIFVVPSDGGVMERLTSAEAVHTEDASWSPDGSQILFSSDEDGDYDLYVIDANGGEPRLLTDNAGDDRDPAWSPDGQSIVYASDQGGPGFLEIWRMQADGTGAEQLTDASNNSYAPAWSPDGSAIAFISDRHIDADLFMMRADGTDERVLTIDDGSAEDRDPTWSPDGYWIAFSSKSRWWSLRDIPDSP